jgi:hypothetical protein
VRRRLAARVTPIPLGLADDVPSLGLLSDRTRRAIWQSALPLIDSFAARVAA